MITFESNLDFVRKLDSTDELASYRSRFFVPQINGKPAVYLTGNSLGLQPRKTREYIDEELKKWSSLAVLAHTEGIDPWLPYHELITPSLARLTGCAECEVVAMNALTVNLHLMLISFYRPTRECHEILMEAGAFPSDRYAVSSQTQLHGFPTSVSLLEPRSAEDCLRTEDVIGYLEKNHERIALILLGYPNYRTGQAYEIGEIARAARRLNIFLGLDLAHGIGNIPLQLHDWGVDFAVWCSYKYLNAGPGGLAGVFVHERHHRSVLPRLTGWWGHNKKTRFEMPDDFDPIPTVEAWQLSNPPILQAAALRASLELFDEAGMTRLRKKSERLTLFFEFLCKEISLQQVTPQEPSQRGCQLSFRHDHAMKLVKVLREQGILCDYRHPDLIRVAPVPLYNSFEDVRKCWEGLCLALS